MQIYIAAGDILHLYIISTSVFNVEGLERNPKVISASQGKIMLHLSRFLLLFFIVGSHGQLGFLSLF